MVNDVHGKRMYDLLFSLNLDQHVNSSTHAHGHTLYHVITWSSDAIIQNLQIHVPSMSDHRPLTLTLTTKKLLPERKQISYRKIKDIDMCAFRQDIEGSSLIQNPAGGSVDEMIEQYN